MLALDRLLPLPGSLDRARNVGRSRLVHPTIALTSNLAALIRQVLPNLKQFVRPTPTFHPFSVAQLDTIAARLDLLRLHESLTPLRRLALKLETSVPGFVTQDNGALESLQPNSRIGTV